MTELRAYQLRNKENRVASLLRQGMTHVQVGMMIGETTKTVTAIRRAYEARTGEKVTSK